jgi:hypothetical protein
LLGDAVELDLHFLVGERRWGLNYDLFIAAVKQSEARRRTISFLQAAAEGRL